MKKLLSAAIVALTLAACGTATTSITKKSPTASPSPFVENIISSKCADTFAKEISTNVALGAYECMSDQLKFDLWWHQGVTNDEQLIQLLSDTEVYDLATRPPSIPLPENADPRKFEYHMYPASKAGTPAYIQEGKALLVVEDKDGKVVKAVFV